MSEETTVTIPPAAAVTPPATPAVTVEHISAIHRRLDQIAHAIEVGFRAVFSFVRREAPAVAAGAEAVATALPVVGPVARVIEGVAGEAAAVVNCANQHGNPCMNRACENFNKETPPAP